MSVSGGLAIRSWQGGHCGDTEREHRRGQFLFFLRRVPFHLHKAIFALTLCS